MSIFKEVTVSVDFFDAKTIRWAIHRAYLDRPTTFCVQIATAGGDFANITPYNIDACFFVYDGKLGVIPDRNSYYRVGAFDSNGVLLEYSIPVREGFCPLSKTDFGYVKELARRECKTIETYSGVPGVLLKRRTTGTLCPYCTDSSIVAQENNYCTHCEGTGYVGGYYSPIDMPLQFMQHPNHTKVHSDTLGSTEPGLVVQGRILAYPWVETGDIWVSKTTNDRYKIVGFAPGVIYKDMLVTKTVNLLKQDKSIANILNSAEVTYKLSSNGPSTGGDFAWRGLSVDDC